jgi:EAL domain-containing protein (putative c-di-GMP-specific phosphodiesterase class I)
MDSPAAPDQSVAPARGHVLLVDDEPAILRLYSRSLRQAGFAVTAISHSKDVIEALERLPVDVVLTDISLPGLSGIDILRAVRQRDADLPVILMTGATDIATAMKAVELGALRYLAKPIAASDLKDVVQQAMQVRRTAQVTRRAVDHYVSVARQDSIKADMVARFERALATLYMVYQPIVSWSSRSVYGYEALVRTREPMHSNPHDLFATAEALGRLQDVGRAIRRSVSVTLETAREMTEPVFVNLHPRDLDDEELITGRCPLSKAATRVVLEITERAPLEGTTDLLMRLSSLRNQGFRLAVDDLGAGYAGLTSLANIRPDIVKLDMSLVRSVASEPTKKTLISTLVRACSELGMTVVSEGVETEGERDALIRFGCDVFQGYLFGRPGAPFPHAIWPELAASCPETIESRSGAS